jgi:CTP synthase (UTP-ammonia lyase)
MRISGESPDGRLVEIVELDNQPWYSGMHQFHRSSNQGRENPIRCCFLNLSSVAEALVKQNRLKNKNQLFFCLGGGVHGKLEKTN